MNRAGDEENIPLTRCDNPEHDQLVCDCGSAQQRVSRPAAVGAGRITHTARSTSVALLCRYIRVMRLARARIASHSSCKWAFQRRHVP